MDISLVQVDLARSRSNLSRMARKVSTSTGPCEPLRTESVMFSVKESAVRSRTRRPPDSFPNTNAVNAS